MDRIRLLAAGIRGSMDTGTWDESRKLELLGAWDEFTIYAAVKLAREANSFADLVGYEGGDMRRAA